MRQDLSLTTDIESVALWELPESDCSNHKEKSGRTFTSYALFVFHFGTSRKIDDLTVFPHLLDDFDTTTVGVHSAGKLSARSHIWHLSGTLKIANLSSYISFYE